MKKRIIENPIVMALVPAGLAFLIYLPSLQGGFVWDDTYYVKNNRYLREWKHLPSYFTSKHTFMERGTTESPFRYGYRPIRNVSYLVDYKIWKLKPFGFHLQNILLHSLCVLLLFLLVKEITSDTMTAFIASLLFAVHPVLTESVAWIKSRDVLLCGGFTFFSFLLFVKWVKRRHFSLFMMLAIVLLYLFALFSYLAAISMIVAVGGFWVFFRRSLPVASKRKTFTVCGLLIIIGIGFVIVRHFVIGRTSQCSYFVGGSFLWTMITMIAAFVEYIGLLIFPLSLNADYLCFAQYRSFVDLKIMSCLAVIVALSALWIWGIKKGRNAECFAAFWTVAFLAPFANIVPMMQIMAERFLYLPCAGFALLAGLFWKRIYLKTNNSTFAKIFQVLSLIVFLALLARTETRIYEWSDSLSLHKSSFSTSPSNRRAHQNYGIELYNDGRFLEAVAILEEYDRLYNSRGRVYSALAWSYAKTGNSTKALEIFRMGIDKFPDMKRLYCDYALVASENGLEAEAKEMISKALEKFGSDPELEFKRGIVLQNSGEYKEAKDIYLKLLVQHPEENRIQIMVNLGRIANVEKDSNAVKKYYNEVLKIAPSHSEAQRMLESLTQP